MKHYLSKNKSFIELHNYLKHLGIDNNAFHLDIHDMYLIHTDPHDKILCRELVERVKHEVCNNMYYFMRELCKIELDRKLLSILWCMSNCKRFVIRQNSENTDENNKIFCFLAYYIAYVQIVHQTMSLTNRNIVKSDMVLLNTIANDLIDNMPYYLKCNYVAVYKSIKPEIEITDCCDDSDLMCLTNESDTQIIMLLSTDIDLSILQDHKVIEFNESMYDSKCTQEDTIIII